MSKFSIDINCFYCFSLSVQHITATCTIWQNIDTLESVAGLEAEKLVEAHGSFRLGHCLDCHAEYTQDWMKGESISVTVWIVMRSTLKTGWKVSQSPSLSGLSCGVHSRLDERWVNLGHCLECHGEYTQDWIKSESTSVTVWNVMRSILKTWWKVSQSLSHCLECHVKYTQDWMKGESISVTISSVMWSTLKTGWKVSQFQSLCGMSCGVH